MRGTALDEVLPRVAEIVGDVRSRGDKGLLDWTEQLDGERRALRVAADELEAARIDDDVLAAVRSLSQAVASFSEAQRPRDTSVEAVPGVVSERRWLPLSSVGIYVPGGRYAYPSSLVMAAVPARVAGVERIAIVTPRPAEATLAVARELGIDEVYAVGGAQAIAALAYGTETIAPVVKIVGPGNAYVAAAKRQVYGTVGIDSIAGPSEVLVIADKHNNPDWIAADLLAQAEHDTAAQSILMTDDADFAAAVESAVMRQLAALPKVDIATASWRDFGAIILLGSLDEAPALADRIAAEHLEIATQDADALSERIRNAGAIFLGQHTPEVIGDYVSGSNHVLPTARSARFSSGLGVLDYMKRTSILKLNPASLKSLAPAAMTLARAEGLEAHRQSVAIRINPET
jgi:histidinol dehydrogenase